MTIGLEIQIQNGKVKITMGGGTQASATTTGGDSPGDPSSATASGGPESNSACCCAPVVVGPIVLDGSSMQRGSMQVSGGDSPGDPSSATGSGGHGSKGPGGSKLAKGGDSPGDPSSATASGGPESRTGCCPTIVIGPIVITGCCSGQSVESAPIVRTAKEATVNPPPHILSAARTTVGDFTIQAQAQSNWCWSAVATSVSNFLNPPSAAKPGFTQETLATELLNRQSPTAPVNCSLPDQAGSVTHCNQPEALDAALTVTGNLMKDGFLEDKYLSFECLQSWVNAQTPVCARIAWRDGGAHFIILDGCCVTSSGQKKVHVQDPSPTKLPPSFQDYDAVVDHYKHLGHWQDSYLLTK